MRWLLITTMGRNPGDEFIRLGIMNMIREIDSNPNYILIDKDISAAFAEVTFDKCILCGMPVFWSDGENRNNKAPWWEKLILGWATEIKENFLVLGAGSFFPPDIKNNSQVVYKEELIQSAKDILARSFAVVARDHLAAQMTETQIPALVCPAIFSVMDYKRSNELKLANLMPSGGHITEYAPQEVLIWNMNKKRIAQILIDNGFSFIAHNIAEIQFAQQCGWEDIITYDGNLSSLLQYYGRCGKFFGNRVHGAITARGNNADTWAVGYDSRMEAVRLSGARVSLPTELNLEEIEQWAKAPIEPVPFDFDNEFNKQVDIVRQFASATADTNLEPAVTQMGI